MVLYACTIAGIHPLGAYMILFQMHFFLIHQMGKALDQHTCYQMEDLKELGEQRRLAVRRKLILLQAMA